MFAQTWTLNQSYIRRLMCCPDGGGQPGGVLVFSPTPPPQTSDCLDMLPPCESPFGRGRRHNGAFCVSGAVARFLRSGAAVRGGEMNHAALTRPDPIREGFFSSDRWVYSHRPTTNSS